MLDVVSIVITLSRNLQFCILRSCTPTGTAKMPIGWKNKLLIPFQCISCCSLLLHLVNKALDNADTRVTKVFFFHLTFWQGKLLCLKCC
ncbi:hypothetical protein Fmac_014807 [Flemingia macrophylla]|uniref:Uncharacterized protein n=1 Tax=Flemingia macrophylla TaxID=520843 RepID=A0ABD1MCT5_9FABA